MLPNKKGAANQHYIVSKTALTSLRHRSTAAHLTLSLPLFFFSQLRMRMQHRRQQETFPSETSPVNDRCTNEPGAPYTRVLATSGASFALREATTTKLRGTEATFSFVSNRHTQKDLHIPHTTVDTPTQTGKPATARNQNIYIR